MEFCPQKHKKPIYDSIRKQWVSDTPEERVRQKVLYYLVNTLGYPELYIVVERELKELLPLHQQEDTCKRRVDILCFKAKTARPLLLIECKSGTLRDEMRSQILGYNAVVKAPVMALVNESTWQIVVDQYSKNLDSQPACIPSYESFRNY